MRRQILLASVGAIAISGSAFAADLRPPPVYLPPPPLFTWNGLYLGAQMGYVWGSDPIRVDSIAPSAFFNTQPDGVIGGIHAGYNLQLAQWVAGVEGTVDGSSLNGTRFSDSGMSIGTRTDVRGSIRARLGVALDRVLIYATGGAAFAGFTNNYAFGALTETDSKTRAGWTVGGGLEYALTNNWLIGAEYRYSDYGHVVDHPFPTLPLGNIVIVTHHLTDHQVQARLSYKFTPFAPAPVVAKY